MDLTLSARQKALIEQARALAHDVLAPNADRYDRSATHPEDDFTALREAGFDRILVPERYGGMGRGQLDYCLALHELAQGSAATATGYNMHNNAVVAIDLCGDENQKRRWFTRVVDEHALMGSWGSEPGRSISSPRGAFVGTTLAQTQQGFFEMTGRKYFCSLATGCQFAQIHAIHAERAGQEAVEDIVMAMVRVPSPGLTIADDWDPFGMRATVSPTVSMERVRVEPDDLIGPPGAAYRVGTGEGVFTCYAAIYTGLARAALKWATDYSMARVIQPDNIRQTDLPWIRQRIGQLAAQIDAAYALTLQAAWQLDEDWGSGRTHGVGLRARVVATRTVLDVTSAAFELCGGSTVMRRHPLERYYREARTQTLMAPTYESQILGIAAGIINRATKQSEAGTDEAIPRWF